jgi:hypothetical protein
VGGAVRGDVSTEGGGRVGAAGTDDGKVRSLIVLSSLFDTERR